MRIAYLYTESWAEEEKLRPDACNDMAKDLFEQASVLEGHKKAVVSVKFRPCDGGLVASASADKSARIWDVDSGECRATLEGHPQGICDVAWNATGNYLCTASDDHTLKLWVRRCIHGHVHGHVHGHETLHAYESVHAAQPAQACMCQINSKHAL